MKGLLVLTLVLGVFLMGCGEEVDPEPEEAQVGYGEQNGWVFKDATVAVGNNPPQPEELGIVGFELKDGPFIEGHDLASFGRRWNTIADDFEMEGLKIDEFEVTYGKQSVEAVCEIEDWLTVFVLAGYGPEYITFAGVEWDIDPDLIGDKVTGAWGALIYASRPEITDDVLIDIINELGIFTMSMGQLADADITTEIHGYEYDFFSTDRWGAFEVSPAR